MSSHLSAAGSKRKTFNTQGRVTTICNKIVEIRSSSGVTSEHKNIHTPFSPHQLGCLLFPTGSLTAALQHCDKSGEQKSFYNSPF